MVSWAPTLIHSPPPLNLKSRYIATTTQGPRTAPTSWDAVVSHMLLPAISYSENITLRVEARYKLSVARLS
jgi:hypothetical protein